jgi:hypothetical protein
MPYSKGVDNEEIYKMEKTLARARDRKDLVNVMKDKVLMLEDIEAPHTLGGASYMLFIYIGSWAWGRDDEDDLSPNAQKKGTLNSPHLQRNWPQLGGSSLG